MSKMNTAICEACQKTITTTRFIKCSSCSTSYHHICVNTVTNDKGKLNDKWLCPSCRAKEPKSDNTNTPIRTDSTAKVAACASSPTDLLTAASRPHKRLASSSPKLLPDENKECMKETQAFSSELRLLRLDMAEVKSGLKLFTDSITKWNERLDNFETRISLLEKKDLEVFNMKETIMQLQDQLNTQLQNSMRNEVELMGINETSNENLHHIAMTTALKIGVKLSEEDIDWVSRTGARKISANSPVANFPRPIIVKILRKSKRDEILKAAKLRRNLTSEEIVAIEPKRRIFINEHLTKSNRILFREARTRSKENKYKFCWINNGLIHCRKEEGKPAITIKCKDDLDRLFGTNSNPSTEEFSQ